MKNGVLRKWIWSGDGTIEVAEQSTFQALQIFFPSVGNEGELRVYPKLDQRIGVQELFR
jgi:hypothetical protein